jgi:ribosome recycling factor
MSTPDTILKSAKEKMQKAIASVQHELGTLRTGRPNPGLLDRILVDYYGTPTPVRQMANVSVTDGTTLLIQPYEKTQLSEIEKAISKSDLGLTPGNDGSVLRIIIPPLSQERRKELAKLASKMGEDGKIAIRNVRRDAVDEANKLKKDGDISEDEARGLTEQIQKVTDQHVKQVDELISEKEKEILTV